MASKGPILPKPDDGALDTCVICLEPVSERAIAVPCNHCCFDFLCLLHWQQQQSKCPLCKASITAVEYNWQSPTKYSVFRVRSTSEPLQPSRGIQERDDQRARIQPGPESPVTDPAILKRRFVYSHHLYSFHIGSNRISGFRSITPPIIASSLELQSKARNWIRRELRAISSLPSGMHFGQTGNQRPLTAEFLIEYIVAILRNVDLRDSNGKAQELLREYFGRENARIFLHELESWMRSPFTNLRDWDQIVQYQEQLPDDSK